MSPFLVALIILAAVSAAASIGFLLRRFLPSHHLSSDAKDSVKLGVGLVTTLTALVLGLLIASAKGSYDTEKSEITQMAAKIAFLDRLLVRYGSDASDARTLLHQTVSHMVSRIWPQSASAHSQLNPNITSGEELFTALQNLSPTDESQKLLKAQALSIAFEISQMRWLLFVQSGTSISIPLLVIVVSWLCFIFLSFGLFAPTNSTVIASFLITAIAVSGAIFLILELDSPFDGILQISSTPMRSILSEISH